MGDAIGVMMTVILVMSVSGMAGYRIAKDYNRDPIKGLLLGVALPLLGVGVLMVLGRKSRKS